MTSTFTSVCRLCTSFYMKCRRAYADSELRYCERCRCSTLCAGSSTTAVAQRWCGAAAPSRCASQDQVGGFETEHSACKRSVSSWGKEAHVACRRPLDLHARIRFGTRPRSIVKPIKAPPHTTPIFLHVESRSLAATSFPTPARRSDRRIQPPIHT